MNTMFHVVITLNSGYHKTLRAARYAVAHLIYEFRKYQQALFKRVTLCKVGDEYLLLNDIKSFKIVYENTGHEYLTVA